MATTKTRKTSSKKSLLPFRHHLVLNQWLFSLFGFDSLNGQFALGKREAPTLEAFRDRFQLMGETLGRNAEGEHLIIQRIREHLNEEMLLSDEQLLEYDRRIKTFTDTINTARQNAGADSIEWKYFQYLTLLFTEAYLDFLFTRPEELLAGVNSQIKRWNAHWLDQGNFNHKPLISLNPEDDLWPQMNMLAYWSATGSGKTLIMHANILQYRYYLKRYGKTSDINKIILLTPNEGLTHQHLQDLELSGIRASEFSAKGGELFAQDVIVIDINKFRDSEKNKTVAVDSFGPRNLLLVDEGHRGTSSGGGSWYDYRKKLCAKGFSFEYSATFAQSSMKHDELRQTYTKAILFDYSYRHFYGDGYGKQSQILNMERTSNVQDSFRYLVASLLAYYQQLRLFEDQKTQLAHFNLVRPLWVFVSSKVTANMSTGEASDTVKALIFINKVLHNRDDTIAAIHDLLNQGMVAKGGVNLLAGRFNYLKELDSPAEAIYQDILERVFHSTGGRLYIENITGVAGEIALRAGVSDTPFGVINVGDDSKLVKLCRDNDLHTQDSRFSASLFRRINNDKSTINLLMGSKKFTEGWSSWRVSNMTLMNVGKNEGAQIIQLFGRGVRLQGWNTTLKRSAELTAELKQAGIERPRHIGIMETLNIFGLEADYIAQFRKELEDEEIPINEGLDEFIIELQPMKGLPDDLNVIRVKNNIANKAVGGAGSAFLELAEQVVLKAPTLLQGSEKQYFCNPPRVRLDFYPQVGKFATDNQGSQTVGPKQQYLKPSHLALLDTQALYFELLAFKHSKRWSNLTIPRDVIEHLLQDTSWYHLLAPDEAMALGRLTQRALWHDMAISLLRKYTELFYAFRRKQWESDKLEYRPITENTNYLPGVSEPTPQGSFTVTLDRVRHESLIKRLDNLRNRIAEGDTDVWGGKIEDGLEFIWCERHFYQPLLASAQGLEFQVTPVALNKGEADFVKDIHKATKDGIFDGFEVYLLRNQTGQGAVGVFIDGGFYPDFILWLVKGKQQKVIFVDPKGLRHHTPDDPKVRFHQTIKDIEADLRQQSIVNSNISLHAFLISGTRSDQLSSQWKDDTGQAVTKEMMESWNILFREEDDQYLIKLLAQVA